MHLEDVRHVRWTCRWGHFAGTADAEPEPGADHLTWSCCHPELSPKTRQVLASECAGCRHWEANLVPPCAAIGWSGSF